MWSMELVGTGRFDANDSDWSCDEITDFGTRVGLLSWNKEAKWDGILKEMISVVTQYLETGKYAEVLKSKAGVGIGFVDGDIELLYNK